MITDTSRGAALMIAKQHIACGLRWDAYVDRLEGGWLSTPAAKGKDAGTPADWPEETHRAPAPCGSTCRKAGWSTTATTPEILPALDRELGLAGLRLARFLIDVQAPGSAPHDDDK